MKKTHRSILVALSVSFSSALYLRLEQDHAAYAYPYAHHGIEESAFQIRQLKAVEINASPSQTLAEVSNVLAVVIPLSTELSHFLDGSNDHKGQELASNLKHALVSVGEVLWLEQDQVGMDVATHRHLAEVSNVLAGVTSLLTDLSQLLEEVNDPEAQELAAKINHALDKDVRVLDETGRYKEEDELTNICGRCVNIINTLPTSTSTPTANQNKNQVDFVLKDLFHKAATTPAYQPYHFCHPFDKTKPTLILGKGKSDPWNKTSDKSWKELKIYHPDRPYGRTGNRLYGFIRTLQYVRDHNLQLGMLYNTYMLDDITSMFMVQQNGEGEEDWVTRMERTFCIKIFFTPEDLEGVNRYSLYYEGNYHRGNYNVGKTLFRYTTAKLGTEEKVSRQFNTLKLLYQHYNTGIGVNVYGNQVKDMCSGTNAVFFRESASETQVMYSAIHHRQLEASGPALLKRVANSTGCDPRAALDMTPEYIKSILEPLGMLQYPIVLMTDGENERGLKRLKDDPDIGPKLRLVPEYACWVGGDITLGVVANVFIGNPASTLSGVIAQSRAVFGYGNTYMYRARNKNGQWTTTCTDDCLFGVRVPREE